MFGLSLIKRAINHYGSHKLAEDTDVMRKILSKSRVKRWYLFEKKIQEYLSSNSFMIQIQNFRRFFFF